MIIARPFQAGQTNKVTSAWRSAVQIGLGVGLGLAQSRENALLVIARSVLCDEAIPIR